MCGMIESSGRSQWPAPLGQLFLPTFWRLVRFSLTNSITGDFGPLPGPPPEYWGRGNGWGIHSLGASHAYA
jgi:hypothetical protein